jgi:uncharacterized protein YprB with RNaseH-like and TPR domain
MELRGRLEEITRGRKKPAPPLQEPPAAEPAAEAPAGAAIPGSFVSTPRGEIWVNQTRTSLRNRFGGIYLLDALSLSGETASMLGMDEALASFDPGRAVYLDTETSGLELSTATVPFLIGLGFIEGEEMVLKQLFIDRIEKEPAVLELLGDFLEGRSQLVTFNGRTYDVPLLKTRYIFNRLESDIDRRLNFDLLHVVRRIYKRRIQDCSLVSCERQVLGHMREGDIPGEMIPGVYVSFLRENRSALMPLVFHHNIQDIVAMVALLGAVAQLASSHEAGFEGACPDDLLSLAKVGARRGRHRDAEKIWDFASESLEGNRKVESLVGLARLARRRQDFASAAKLLDMALEEQPDSPPIHLMLSKICEHDIEDFARALKHAAGARGAEDEARWRKRIKRLEKKLQKPG